MTEGTPVQSDQFFHDGRGPALQRAHWSATGATLLAIDYLNPADAGGRSGVKHVRFLKPQVVMITPEEVIGDALGDLTKRYRPAAMFDRGRSPWLASFAQQHLGRCRHYQLLFYDELVDIIAEGVEVIDGGYIEGAG